MLQQGRTGTGMVGIVNQGATCYLNSVLQGLFHAKLLRKEHRGTIWMAGTLMALPLSVPLLNLVIPILGAATFTHIYHRVAKSAG